MTDNEHNGRLVPTSDSDLAGLVDAEPELYEPLPIDLEAASEKGHAGEELTELQEISGAIWPPLQFQMPQSPLPFPVEVFPLPLQVYCQEVADAMLAPLDFVGASMLTVAGAAIGQSANIEVKGGWAEAPILFMILVAPPGNTKTPVIRSVVEPLTAADDRLRNESLIARRRWEEEKKAVAACPSDKENPLSDEVAAEPPLPEPEPPQLRAIVKDITRESLVIILADNPRGVLCDPDEAAGWVASFNEYKGKGGADRQFWLSIWSCNSVSVDRKGGREARHVTTPFVAVLGGLPPDMLTSLKDERGRDDGFMDRILFVYPEKFPPQHWSDVELSEQAKRDWSGAISTLFTTPMSTEAGQPKPHRINFTSEARCLWVKWWNAHASETECTGFSDRLSGVWSKMRSHAARFALILSMLRRACDPDPITMTVMNNDKPSKTCAGPDPLDRRQKFQFGIAGTSEVSAGDELPFSHRAETEDVQGAIKLVDYFKSQLLRVADQMTGGIGNPDAQQIVDWIRRKLLTSFRQAEVGSDLRRFRDNPRVLTAALRFLVELGAIRLKPEPPGPPRRGPRPTPTYDVNPDLLRAPEITGNTRNSSPHAQDQTINGESYDSSRSKANPECQDREVLEI
jgi:Protein of unknown function (DUF3987)